MWSVAIFAAALAQTPAPDWPFWVTNCTDFTACVWRADGSNEVNCCNETLKQGRLCRECTNSICNPVREACLAQNATGKVDAVCKHCLTTAARIKNATQSLGKFNRPGESHRPGDAASPTEPGFRRRDPRGPPPGRGKGPPRPYGGKKGKGSPRWDMAKDKDKAKALQKAKAAQEAAEKARKMFPNGKKGQKPSPHHPRPGGKRGPQVKQKKDL